MDLGQMTTVYEPQFLHLQTKANYYLLHRVCMNAWKGLNAVSGAEQKLNES